MCTLSYIRTHDTQIFTSIRDVHESRQETAAPIVIDNDNTKICYTPDPKSGGTWLAVSSTQKIAVLLNGGTKKHVPQAAYAVSRGQLLMDVIQSQDSSATIEAYDLSKVEPCTVVVYHQNLFVQFIWDGTTLSKKYLDINTPQIWSSATLYNQQATELRQLAFQQFVFSQQNISKDHIIQFHKTAIRDSENGFIIKRDNGVCSTSITQVVISNGNSVINYEQLLTGLQSDIQL